ncbi:hypothetical protein FDK12_13425 [Arthrobacter sp. NamB2]|uniref:hypothetical protein n=1 Tax=Arthrobacter sp. NamB2 TaxID=2576035 RepID=UPI0010CA0010|nr:hypothetical protein [Arthrobacter sp. NamB2]TKV26381.1 hypothetical protein FDK12_13425 [Arthrobacter sp. NamB2]
MGLLRSSAVLGVATLALTSCAPDVLACTEIGAQQGLSFTVAGGPAAVADSLGVSVCTDDGCSAADVALHPGSTTTSETCTPDGVCSARSTPDGTLTGFATLALSEEEVDAEVTLRRVDGTTAVHTARVVPAVVYPNGRHCGGEAVQGSLVLDDSGLRAG